MDQPDDLPPQIRAWAPWTWDCRPLILPAVVVLAFTLLLALAVISPFILPGNDLAQAAFRYTWAVTTAYPVAARLLMLTDIVAVVVLVRAVVTGRLQ